LDSTDYDSFRFHWSRVAAFDVRTPSASTGTTLIGNRLSYVFLSASGPLGWSAAAADFYVYFPPKASRYAILAMTASGLILGKLFVEFLGIGLGSGLSLNPTWKRLLEPALEHSLLKH
jgi:purine-cytosine permease-like protein